MNSRQLKYVLTIAEERSFTEAAKKLYIAQPSLSQYVNKLEQELGHELFDRTVTPLRLTVAGETYVKAARKILDIELQMEQQLRDMNDSQYGKLTVGAAPYYCTYVLPTAIKRFSEKYPNYDYVVSEQTRNTLLKKMEHGEIDVSITLLPVDHMRYEVADIMTEYMLLAVPIDHPVNDKLTVLNHNSPDIPYPTVDLREMRGVPFVTVDRSKQFREGVDSVFQQAEIQPKFIAECTTAECCHAMAVAGIGMTIVQSSIARYGDFENRVKYYAIKQEYPVRKVVAIYRKNRYISQAALDFIRILQLTTPHD